MAESIPFVQGDAGGRVRVDSDPKVGACPSEDRGPVSPGSAATDALEEFAASSSTRPMGPDSSGPIEPEPETDWAEALQAGFTGLLHFAESKDPIWAATEEEIRALAKAWAPVCDRYLGPSIGIEGAAILASVAFILPRWHGRKRVHEIEASPARNGEATPETETR